MLFIWLSGNVEALCVQLLEPGVVLKDVLEVRPCGVRGATAYSVKVTVRLEINANRSNQGVGMSGPADQPDCAQLPVQH